MDDELKIKIVADMSKIKTQLNNLQKQINKGIGLDSTTDSTKQIGNNLNNIKRTIDSIKAGSLASSAFMFEHSSNRIKNSFIRTKKELTGIKRELKAVKDIGGGALAVSAENFKKALDNLKNPGKGVSGEVGTYFTQIDSLKSVKGFLKEYKTMLDEEGLTDVLKDNGNEIVAQAKKTGEVIGGALTNSLKITLSGAAIFTVIGAIFTKIFSKLAEKINSIDLSTLKGKTKEVIKGMQDQWRQLKADFSALGITLVQTLAPAINFIIRLLSRLINFVRSAISNITGISFDNVKKSADTATKSVQKLRRETMGFDELNVLPGKDSGSSAAGASEMSYDAGPISKWSEEYRIKVQEAIGTTLKLIGIIMIIAGVLSFNIPQILVGAGLVGLGVAIESYDPDTSNLRTFIDDMANAMMDAIRWAMIAIGIFLILGGLISMSPVKMLLGVGLLGVGIAIENNDVDTSSISGFIGSVEDILAEAMSIISLAVGIFLILKGLISWNILDIVMGIGLCALGISIASMDSKPSTTSISEWGQDLWTQLRKILSYMMVAVGAFLVLKGLLTMNPVDIVLGVGLCALSVAVNPQWSNKVKELFAQLKEGIQNGWQAIKNWWNDKIAPIFTKKYWVDKFNTIKTSISDKISDIKTAMINKIKDLINGVIDKVNSGINKVNSAASFKIGEKASSILEFFTGKKISGTISLLSLPTIPRLATGGITTGSTLANIGEAGREAVLPLENNTEWMDVLANRIASRAQQKVVLNVDGRQLGMATISSINGITAETGSLPLKVF